MKRTLCLLLLAAVLLSFAGCAAAPAEPTAGETEPETAPTAVSAPATAPETEPQTEPQTEPETEPETIPPADCTGLTLDDCVRTGYQQTGNCTDDLGNEYSYSYFLPEILIDCPGAQEINQDIASQFRIRAEEDLANAQQGYGIGIYRMDYTAYIKDGILSLLVQRDYCANDISVGATYNLNLSTGLQASPAEVLALYGLTEDAYLPLAAEAAGEAFAARYGDGTDFSDQNELFDFYTMQLERTKTENDFQSVFIDPEGKLCVLIDLYSLAGADSYPAVLEIA